MLRLEDIKSQHVGLVQKQCGVAWDFLSNANNENDLALWWQCISFIDLKYLSDQNVSKLNNCVGANHFISIHSIPFHVSGFCSAAKQFIYNYQSSLGQIIPYLLWIYDYILLSYFTVEATHHLIELTVQVNKYNMMCEPQRHRPNE